MLSSLVWSHADGPRPTLSGAVRVGMPKSWVFPPSLSSPSCLSVELSLEPGERWHDHPNRRSIEQRIGGAFPQDEVPDESHGGHSYDDADQFGFQLVE